MTEKCLLWSRSRNVPSVRAAGEQVARSCPEPVFRVDDVYRCWQPIREQKNIIRQRK